MRKIWFLICVLGVPGTSWAQTTQASWATLSTLHTGQKIQVVAISSKRHSGTFLSVSDTAISLQEKGGEQTMQRHDVRSVKLMKNADRLRNTLILAGVGAGVGAGIGAATFKACSSSQPFCFQPIGRGGIAAISAVIGFVGGAVVGVLLPTHHTIYTANSH